MKDGAFCNRMLRDSVNFFMMVIVLFRILKKYVDVLDYL